MKISWQSTRARAGKHAVPEQWEERVLVLWQEDVALRSDPTAEHLPQAVARLLGRHRVDTVEEMLGAALARWDGGDTILTLHPDGWVTGASYDGSFLGRVVQVVVESPDPEVDALPRHFRVALSRLQRAVEADDWSSLASINEDLQPIADAICAAVQRAARR